ncbi:MAG: transporter [Alphaproteobacteria bacterium]|nr:transporter [Alphaproteobacteria bacterium]
MRPCVARAAALVLLCAVSAGAAPAAEAAAAEAERVGGGALTIFEPVIERGLHGFFELLDKQQFVFLLLALALGYPLGRLSVGGISLGPTAGTLLTGVAISLVAKLGFDITYSIPGLVSTIFMLLFMYALGLRVGPQFFAGLKAGAFPLVVIALVVWALNWILSFGGAALAGLEPGFAAGLIAGSHTVTAVIGVATSALQSGAWNPPEGTSADQVGANIAAGYAISYILSSIGTILLIRYLPQMFGRDAVADAKQAEAEMSGGATEPVPGAAGSLTLGFSPLDIRAFRVEHEAFAGKTIEQLFDLHPRAPVLRVVRDGAVIEPADNPTIQQGDVIAVRADVDDMILKGQATVGPEVDDPTARNIQLEAADLRIGSREMSGKTVADLDREVGFGLQLKALFRQGQQMPLGPQTVIEFGDVARIVGPAWCIQRAAKALGGRPILDTMATEVTFLAVAMAVGYLVGIFTVTIGGIPFALGSSAGCLLAGICVSYLRSRNPEFGGPVSEGARSFLQDIGLNMFVAVLAANVGPKVIQSFQGTTVIWVALIGTLAALLPPFVAFVIGFKHFKMNSVVAAGATTGARNNTPGLNAICDESKSAAAAAPYPVTYAIGTVTALVGGYVAMILS